MTLLQACKKLVRRVQELENPQNIVSREQLDAIEAIEEADKRLAQMAKEAETEVRRLESSGWSKADFANALRHLLEDKNKKPLADGLFYALHIYGDVEPILHGPFKTEAIRDAKARKIRDEDEAQGDLHDGIYAIQINKGMLEVESYSVAFFENQNT